MSRVALATDNCDCVSQEGVACPPPAMPNQMFTSCKPCMCCTRVLCRRWWRGLPHLLRHKPALLRRVVGESAPAPPLRPFSCSVTQQKCLLCLTADMSAVSHSRHVCSVTHSRHFCSVTQQTCLLCQTSESSKKTLPFVRPPAISQINESAS